MDIQEGEVDIERSLSEKTKDFSVKTMIHIHRLFEEYGYEKVFWQKYNYGTFRTQSVRSIRRLLSISSQPVLLSTVSGYVNGRYPLQKQ